MLIFAKVYMRVYCEVRKIRFAESLGSMSGGKLLDVSDICEKGICRSKSIPTVSQEAISVDVSLVS